MAEVAKYLEARPVVDMGGITAPKALDTIRVLQSGILSYARLIECRASDEADIVVVELEPELSQKRVHPIQPREVLALEFSRSDQKAPWVFSLRADFPVVPHLNLMPVEFPRCLCIYEEPYRQQKRYWTAPKFIEDIRRWLSLTALGQLHDDEQALEPMLLNSPIPIVVPADLLEVGDDGLKKLVISGQDEDGKIKALIARNRSGDIPPRRLGGYLGLVLRCPEQEHGVIRRQPANLKNLHDLTFAASFDLREAISHFLLEIRQDRNALDYPLILIILIPKIRRTGGPIETIDRYAFLFHDTLREIGEGIGIWQRMPGSQELGLITIRDPDQCGEGLEILPLNLHFQLSRQKAALMNGFSESNDLKITAIGAGALGSQAITNLFRAGFGIWTIVDNDRMLPHNFARHALFGEAGFPKAHAMSDYLHNIMPDVPPPNYIVADVLDPQDEEAERLAENLKGADLILDFSASTSVGRHLAHQTDYPGRRISLFLNPTGTDLVCLAEDTARKITLDQLDLQYYRAVTQHSELAKHLHAPSRLRYGQTCRDLSVTIPQDYVALLSAVASRAVHNLSKQNEASISIWRIDPETMSVSPMQIRPLDMQEMKRGEWRVLTDAMLLEKLFRTRAERLPRETGGILIGSWDMERKTVYIMDMIPAPADSVERTTLFVRGCQGLAEQVVGIEHQTLWELGYVGEWHSHPDGAACDMSGDDQKVLDWLKAHMGEIGLPGLMMIACDNMGFNLFMDEHSAMNPPASEPASAVS